MVQFNQYTSLNSILGYSFRDLQLLRQALTHRSFSSDNNERFEFLGDSILNLIVGEALFQKFPNAKEGQLSGLRSALVCADSLVKIARNFKLNHHLILGEGELKSGGLERDSILSDAVEALIGAIYTEVGFDQCRVVVLGWFAEKLNQLSLEAKHKDAKTQLQEYMQSCKKPLPEYTVVQVMGESHAQQFIVECRVALLTQATSAQATNRREAEKLAAAKALKLLNI
ncbi:MAG: ribonuclease III [Cellvibrio sp.]|nr:ribonuclease III [Cellvibrio sp.]